MQRDHHAKYDARLRAVSDALATVEAPGDFYTSGVQAPFPLPGLVVDGVGEVPLPLTDATAKTLIAASHLAPFGRRGQTLIDTQVRNTWELSTNQFRLENAAFNEFVATQIAETCRDPLGIHDSVKFEAKLYKLLLYEPGGKFERHQDSEKENGMFGTLLLVLPGRFEGGELVVHAPSSDAAADETSMMTRVFDAGTMDPFAIKYAAFYGDCPHEVKPVTSGYRLCLTYNLVKTVSLSVGAELPQFGSNHKLYAALEEALEAYFCADGADKTKRQRTDDDGASSPISFDVTNLESYREAKLVYVLTHKYTQANLSFANLKNRDAAVAASLGRFCDSSKGALGLYLCQVVYGLRDDDRYHSDRDEDDDGITRTLSLQPPWVEYKLQQEVECGVDWKAPFCDGSFTEDVAMCGMLEQKDLRFDKELASDYTGNEGADIERWYYSAALVVAPIDEAFRWALKWQTPSELLESWLKLAASKPMLARIVAHAFGKAEVDWSPTSELGLRVLETIAAIGDLDVLCAMLSSIKKFEFQPRLARIVALWDSSRLAKIATTVGSAWRHRSMQRAKNQVNLIASMLDGVIDSTVLAAVLDAVNPVPSIFCTRDATLSEWDTTPEEYTRVLALAMRISEDRMKTLIEACNAEPLVMIVGPAIRCLFEANKPRRGRVQRPWRLLATRSIT